MLTYIETKDESVCCGCRACEQICPKKAISMEKNREGFYYPMLNSDLCIDCKLCEKVCPEMECPPKNRFLAVYAVQHKDEEILKKSSSGGAFRLLADEVISGGGCVAGCVWDERLQPVFKIADTIDDLIPMQGSKYLSSNTVDIYSQIKKRLNDGQFVLFTGAPCQCAGLLKYLRKPYGNLITADFLCHGMPSQQIFDHYLRKLRKKINSNKIASYSFRDKEKRGWGLVSSYTYFENGKEKKHYTVGMTDEYDCGFLKGYFNRYSCYCCAFRGEERFTDFTFCDYWGVQDFHSELDSTKGVSALTINTEKANDFKKRIERKAIWIETEKENVARDNASLLHIDKEDVPPVREEIYKLLNQKEWDSIAKKHFRTKHYWAKRIWYSMPESMVRSIKKLLGRK